MAKHDRNNIKSEHHILPDFLKFLNKISDTGHIIRIIPGPISRQQKGTGRTIFTIGYPDVGGYSCTMKKGSTGQKVYIHTTLSSEQFIELLKKLIVDFDIELHISSSMISSL